MKNAIEIISKKYEGLYQKENYSLVASTDIYVPWMQCTLKCKHRIRRQMSEFDSIIIKCLYNSINNIRDISFVLGIDIPILEAEIENLESINFVKIEDGIISITDKGQISFEERMKDEILTDEFIVYMNCITGEWTVDEQDLKSAKGIEPQKISNNSKISEIQPIVLEKERAVSKDNVENNANLIKDLNTKYNTQIQSIHLMNYMDVQYQIDRVLFYRNDSKKILFSLCDYKNYELDDKLAIALRENYEKRKLFELLQFEKFTKEPEKYLTSNEPVIVKYKKQICGDKYLRNQDIRQLFTNIFDKAKSSIFIVSPWIDNNNYVMTDEILDKIESALRDRKVSITVGYGYTNIEKLNNKIKKYTNLSNNQDKIKNDKDYQTYLMAEKMKKRFKNYSNFKIFHVGTHEKILSYDNRYTLIASYNFMSYDGGESYDYSGYNFRFEGGVLIEDEDFTKHVRMCFEEL